MKVSIVSIKQKKLYGVKASISNKNDISVRKKTLHHFRQLYSAANGKKEGDVLLYDAFMDGELFIGCQLGSMENHDSMECELELPEGTYAVISVHIPLRILDMHIVKMAREYFYDVWLCQPDNQYIMDNIECELWMEAKRGRKRRIDIMFKVKNKK